LNDHNKLIIDARDATIDPSVITIIPSTSQGVNGSQPLLTALESGVCLRQRGLCEVAGTCHPIIPHSTDPVSTPATRHKSDLWRRAGLLHYLRRPSTRYHPCRVGSSAVSQMPGN